MKFLGSLMLKNFGSHLSWKLSWTPSHKWSPLFQWTWTRLNFPLQKGLPQCTAGRETWFTGATLIEIGVYIFVPINNKLLYVLQGYYHLWSTIGYKIDVFLISYVIVECYGHVTLSTISKIQLVVHYQCCVLIGWATTGLYVIAH